MCIVGAGAAGLTLAHALRGSGLSVLLLESGPVADPDAVNAGEVSGHPYNGLLRGRARGPGGTTTLWPGQCMRLRPADYASWPFGHEELDPNYRAAEAMLGIPPGELERDPWEALGEDGPAFDPTRIEPATAIFVGRRNLADLDVGEVTLLTGVFATRIERGRVEVRDLAGRSAEVEAEVVVLAAGGIETPRLLLVSGLGGDDAGRAFQDHAFCEPARVVGRPRALQDMYGIRLRRGLRWYPKLLLAPALRLSDEPGCMANIVFHYGARSPLDAALRARRALRTRSRMEPRDLLLVARGLPQLAAAAVRVRRGREPAPRPEEIRVLCIAEQHPRGESRIGLADECDPLGVPRARVNWRLGEEERLSIATFLTALDEELRRTGAGSLEREPWIDDERWLEHAFDSFHPAGGACFGTVADADGAVLGAPGVYVCGSALFPRSGCVNPTLTILALAFRLANHLQGR